MNDPYDWLDRSLETIRRADWYRQVRSISNAAGTRITIDGRELINFASNDYLGLAKDNRVINAAIEATKIWGTGATGSRLVCGNSTLHDRLEMAIAKFKQTASARVYSSGYLANLGTMAAIVDRRDLILGDEYNHSSLKNGAKLSGAKTIDYRHGDVAHLESLLKLDRDRYRRCAIVTDTVFSMDGDLCPLPAILDLAEKYRSMVVVDEAHATGVFGATGAGAIEYYGCTGRELIEIGTLSKATGSLGGYVTGSQRLIEFLTNRSPTWIYTTGLSPADTAAALKAIEIIQFDRTLRERLWANIHFLQQALTPFKPIATDSSIFGIPCQSPAAAIALSQNLLERGIFAPAIRPPTVPTSRIRLTVTAAHSRSDLEYLVSQLNDTMLAIF